MEQKTALVFGGSRGIGAACVSRLIADGYQVAYTYISAAPETVATGSLAFRVDIEKPEEVAQVFADVIRDFGGPPDCVIANAGINVPGAPIGQFAPDNFRRLVEVNIIGAFNILTQAARHVVDGGNIIAITTSMVRMSIPGVGPYTATKAAVEALIRSMSKELAPRRIRVNAVAPGPVDTDLFRSGKNEEALRRSASLSPFNRVGDPQEIAEVVSFLVSSKASWVHGQIIQPNGGMI